MAPMTSGGSMRAMRRSRLPRLGAAFHFVQSHREPHTSFRPGMDHPCKVPPRPSGPDVRAGGVPAATGPRGAAVSPDPPPAGTTDTAGANVDEDEVAKFSALASRWWDPEGEFRPLHRLNPIRTDYVASRVDLAGARVVDVGCGGGPWCCAAPGRCSRACSPMNPTAHGSTTRGAGSSNAIARASRSAPGSFPKWTRSWKPRQDAPIRELPALSQWEPGPTGGHHSVLRRRLHRTLRPRRGEGAGGGMRRWRALEAAPTGAVARRAVKETGVGPFTPDRGAG